MFKYYFEWNLKIFFFQLVAILYKISRTDSKIPKVIALPVKNYSFQMHLVLKTVGFIIIVNTYTWVIQVANTQSDSIENKRPPGPRADLRLINGPAKKHKTHKSLYAVCQVSINGCVLLLCSWLRLKCHQLYVNRGGTFMRGRMCRAHVLITVSPLPPHTIWLLVIVKGVDLHLHTNAFFKKSF